jgi:hypothetical protein
MQVFASGCYLGTCTDYNTSTSINGHTFPNAYEASCSIQCGPAETAKMDVNLEGKYSRLNATLGVAKDSKDASDSITIQLIDVPNNSVLYSGSFNYAKSRTLTNFNVSHVLRLRFAFSGPLGKVYGAVGGPIVYP